MAFNLDCVGQSYSAPPELLDEARHAAYAEAVCARPGPDGRFPRPLACFAAVYLLWPVVPQLFSDPGVALDVAHLLHGEQEFSFERPLSFGESVSPMGLITQADRRRGMVFLEFSVEGRDPSQVVVARSRSLFVVREAA